MIVDSGTITAAIARALRNLHKVTIIANAVNIPVELSLFNLDVIMTGGNFRKNSFSLVGPMAEGPCTVECRHPLIREVVGDRSKMTALTREHA